MKISKQDSSIYMPTQSIWLTDDGSDQWKSGYIESKDASLYSYWIINDKSNKRNKAQTKQA